MALTNHSGKDVRHLHRSINVAFEKSILARFKHRAGAFHRSLGSVPPFQRIVLRPEVVCFLSKDLVGITSIFEEDRGEQAVGKAHPLEEPAQLGALDCVGDGIERRAPRCL